MTKPPDTTAASIVVVDDAPANLILLANILEAAGYEVRVANSAQRALTLIERQPPDLVVLDINLPDKDGYAVCRELRASNALRAIPVFFLSADDDASAKRRALEAGGNDYVVKPFEAEDLLGRIAVQLRLTRALADNASSRAQAERYRIQAAATFEALVAMLPGVVLVGRYRLVSRIRGNGAVARFLATRLDSGERVAIDILAPTPELCRALAQGQALSQAAPEYEGIGNLIEAGVTEGGLPFVAYREAP